MDNIEMKYPLCLAAGVDGNEFEETELKHKLECLTNRHLSGSFAVTQMNILMKINRNEEVTVDDIDNCVLLQSLPGEEWKPVRDFEQQYGISDLGRVMSKCSKIIMKRENDKGYRRICARDAFGRKHYLSVHRLVVDAFIPITEEDIKLGRNEVNHINGIKHDDRRCNLERCAHKENMEHAVAAGLTPSKLTHELLAKAVYFYDVKKMEIQDIIALPEYAILGMSYMGMYKAIFRLKYKRFSDIPIPKARPRCIKGRHKTNYDVSIEQVITIRIMKERCFSYKQISRKLGLPIHIVANIGKGTSKSAIHNEDYPNLVDKITSELDN